MSQNLPMPVDTLPSIYTLIEEVDTVTFIQNVRHLQNYGTRECFSPEAVEAQNWIKTQFESYGLSVELQDFDVWGSNPSDNVIATLPGKVTPEEFIIIGAHYDSFTGNFLAPGADDNASGTAGVMEAARILSQHEFEKTIVFCAFSAEEYGLYGSEAYAARCEQQGMNILGYFNMDMIGYQDPEGILHCDLIAPPSAEELAVFYTTVAGIYLPDFPIYDGTMTGGNSDHTSFNNHGYQGIFPFEDDEYHSPFIHTEADTIGTSLNCQLLAMKLIQCGLASAITMSVPFDPVSVRSDQMKFTISLYPNPAIEHVRIDLNRQTYAHFRIISLSGMTLLEGSFSGSTELNIRDLPPGSYIVQVTGDGFTLRRMLIKS